MGQNETSFQQSTTGAQSAWKGFFSQTLYISNRILDDQDGFTYFPEDIEDLVIKESGNVVEAVQIKDISSNLSLSSLASTKSSNNAEGFFNRMASLHKQFPEFNYIRIVYFGSLGTEFIKLEANDSNVKDNLKEKLISGHGLDQLDADWLLSSINFEHVMIRELEGSIDSQIKKFSPILAAPDLAKLLLIQYVFELSRNKGSTSLSSWQEKIYQIGADIAAMDGYFKEYHKSLIRMKELKSSKSPDELHNEFLQGISVHPSHIRMNLDFPRNEWISRIKIAMVKSGVVIVKGVSGQGKSSICYRYLLNYYEEELIYCIRSITSITQAENLVAALGGLAEHTKDLIAYIDVSSGETGWVHFLQELQARGINIPVLIAIRDEDFNMTPINGAQIQFDIIELVLFDDEAQQIYLNYTQVVPHSQHRSFKEAWTKFGGHGPLIEFMYLLSNNLTLKTRLQDQIREMFLAKIQDPWFEILQTVCFAGRIGCPLRILQLKQIVSCDNFYSAIERFKDEYLIRLSDDGEFIEALHPVRAKIIYEVLNSYIGDNAETNLIDALKCTDSHHIQLLLLEYFSLYSYTDNLIDNISKISIPSWLSFAGILRAVLWLDVKRYIEENTPSINKLIKEKGKGWIVFMPNDISGLIHDDKIFAEAMINLIPDNRREAFRTDTLKFKRSFSSLHIDYRLTDKYLRQSVPPSKYNLQDDEEWIAFGYMLFWYAKREIFMEQLILKDQVLEGMTSGDIQARAHALRGMFEQKNYFDSFEKARKLIIARLIEKYCIIIFNVTSDEVCCKFVPPIFSDKSLNTMRHSNFNHFWVIKMLNILQQIFPEKEYIKIELLGVDLLTDLGIHPSDDKVRIHKKNRLLTWITELNSWGITRIEYPFRPDSWIEYIKQVDDMHRISDRFVVNLTQYLEDFYKKNNLDQERWQCITNDYSDLSTILSNDLLLPKSVVDSYCLYREELRNEFSDDMKELITPVHQFLSYSIYNDFRKSNQKTLDDLSNFANQFVPILLARIQKQSLDAEINQNLPIVNLYTATKELTIFAGEYQRLFSNYSTLDHKFHEQEILHMLLLLNLWQHVTKLPPQGYPILSLARQRLKKSNDYLKQGFSKFIKQNRARTISIGSQKFLLLDFDFNDENTIQREYTRVVLNLRKTLLEAIPFRSERFSLETKYPTLFYVPIFNGLPLSGGYSIPVYKLLDVEGAEIASTLFPVELPADLYKSLGAKDELLNLLLDEAISAIASVQLIFTQYNSIISEIDGDSCMAGLEAYLKDFISVFTQVVEKITEPLSKILNYQPESMSTEDISSITNLIKLLEGIETLVDEHRPIEEDSGEVVNKCITELLILQMSSYLDKN